MPATVKHNINNLKKTIFVGTDYKSVLTYLSILNFRNKKNMTNKSLLIVLWSSSIVIVLITITAYCLNFHENTFSNDPERWAQFGDYFGGVLNPFISLINLVILTYLSIRLVKDEDERNKWTLQELARPYGEFSFTTNSDSIELTVHNFGLGPMVINEIVIKDFDGKVYESFENLILSPDKSLTYEYSSFKISNSHCAIGKDGEVRLFRIIGNTNNPNYVEHLKNTIEKLSNITIEIKYSDMYKRKMEPLIERKLIF